MAHSFLFSGRRPNNAVLDVSDARLAPNGEMETSAAADIPAAQLMPVTATVDDAAATHPSPSVDTSTPTMSSSPATGLIQLEDFCFAYETVPALRHLDMQIASGESVVLMGDNGSGKSTLLKALCGLLFAQQGSYRFDGQEVSERSMRNASFAKLLHQRVGFVFQDSDAQLFCARVEDEIAFGPRQMGLPEDAVMQRVEDVCRMLGIDRLRMRAPYALSGGEKKRVALACVLSLNPEVLCLDEPLAGLDRTTRRWLVDFLQQLRSAGKTLVIATHDEALAQVVADRLVYLDEGRLDVTELLYGSDVDHQTHL